MSDRYGSYPPDDEPIIGATYAPPAPPSPYRDSDYIGGTADAAYDDDEFIGDEDDWDDDEYLEDEYYDDYGAVAPARQPMFYVFIGLATLVGGIIVFLLFSMVNGGADDDQVSAGEVKFAVSIDSPGKGSRIEIGKTEEVLVQATSTEPIVRFELFVQGRSVDTVEVAETPPDNRYRQMLKTTFDRRGEYELFVRVTSASNATKDSDKLKVIAIEPVGDKPQTIRGRVVATVNLRSGPGENFDAVGTLEAGQEITIQGRNRASEWLLVDIQGQQRWVKRSAIEPLDSLDLVPVRDVTPTPQPTATNTRVPTPAPSPSASPSASPSPAANAPDFVPVEAVLTGGGSKLQVTVRNVSGNAYDGALVVGVGGDVPGAEVAVDARIGANASAVFEFDVSPPITQPNKRAQVSVDPKNAVREANEANNVATFVLLVPVEEPKLSVGATIGQGGLTVTVTNSGGPISAANAIIEVKLNDQTTSVGASLDIPKGGSHIATGVPRPTGGGTASITIRVNGTALASGSVVLPAT